MISSAIEVPQSVSPCTNPADAGFLVPYLSYQLLLVTFPPHLQEGKEETFASVAGKPPDGNEAREGDEFISGEKYYLIRTIRTRRVRLGCANFDCCQGNAGNSRRAIEGILLYMLNNGWPPS